MANLRDDGRYGGGIPGYIIVGKYKRSMCGSS